jgi:uncharacterized protein YbjT (DUF2867 family)
MRLGYDVHALTRKPESEAARQLEKEGATIAVASFDDEEALGRALKGVDTVFAMSTPYEAGADRETRQGIALVDAAKAAGVRHVVYTSVASADRKTGIAHFDSKAVVERHLQASGVPCTILAPVFFMSNLTSPGSIREGALMMALPANRRLQVVAVEDIGALAVLIIDQPERALGRRIEIASDELTPAQMAEVIARVTGRTVRFAELPMANLRAASAELATMYEWFDRVGYSVDISQLHRAFPEIPWTPFESWAKTQSWDPLLAGVGAHP